MNNFRHGIIEGFFGKPWNWADRAAYADFLDRSNFDFYIYAPKADSTLRSNWLAPFNDQEVVHLQNTAQAYQVRGLSFGIGLSPLDSYACYDQHAREKLRIKISQINDVNADILCILFDDMRGDYIDLAQHQINLINDAMAWSNAKYNIVCPTYYSDDPLLESIFGPAPPNYLSDLGQSLDSEINIFWTGPKVCSLHYPKDHLEAVAEKLQRKPFLWDNSISNDAAKSSNYLKFKAPDLHKNSESLSGYAINPMNQPWLSRIPLLAHSQQIRLEKAPNMTDLSVKACLKLCNPELANKIIRDLNLFQDIGLSQISETDKERTIEEYNKFHNNCYANEIIAWLQGEYMFDPNCLTN